MLRTLPVDPGPLGFVSAGQPDPIMKWGEDGGRRVPTTVQETDDTTGHLLWNVYVLSTGAERPEIITVRVPAKVQPVLTMFGPVEVVGLEVSVRVGKDGKLAGYWSAAEVRDGAQPGRRNGQPEQKPAAEQASA